MYREKEQVTHEETFRLIEDYIEKHTVWFGSPGPLGPMPDTFDYKTEWIKTSLRQQISDSENYVLSHNIRLLKSLLSKMPLEELKKYI